MLPPYGQHYARIFLRIWFQKYHHAENEYISSSDLAVCCPLSAVGFIHHTQKFVFTLVSGRADTLRIFMCLGLPKGLSVMHYDLLEAIPAIVDIPSYIFLFSQDMSITQTRAKCILTILRANADHNGEYKCQASNGQGKATTQCHVNVLPAFQGMYVNRFL